ncbi:hypothetical protein [Prosthecobacter sp.]|jgi:hypothetical protein|uniref:hypothetical protein n=1 Tax=Prosthecobacter sp. TaxID=1965333 RepID=UPI0037846C18
MKLALHILVWLLQLVVLLVLIVILLFFAWFAIELVEDGISSEAMTYEYSTPVGGWDKWRWAKWMNATPGLLLVEGFIGVLVFPLLVILRRLLYRFPKSS